MTTILRGHTVYVRAYKHYLKVIDTDRMSSILRGHTLYEWAGIVVHLGSILGVKTSTHWPPPPPPVASSARKVKMHVSAENFDEHPPPPVVSSARTGKMHYWERQTV